MPRHTQLLAAFCAVTVLATAVQARPHQHMHEHFHERYHQNRQKLIVQRVTDFVVTTAYQEATQVTPIEVATTTSLSNNPTATSAIPSTSCTSSTSACTASITHYNPGLGSCGLISDGTLQNVVALPSEFMSDSESDFYCGRTVEIYNPANGMRANGTVVDKCIGCSKSSLDLSPHFFGELTQAWESERDGWGRIGGIQWWFSD